MSTPIESSLGICEREFTATRAHDARRFNPQSAIRNPQYTALVLAFVFASAHAGDLAPFIAADPGPEGALTWWLHSPVQQVADIDDATPPQNAREGEAVGANPAQKWALHVAAQRFVDLKPLINSRTGMVWCAARIQSEKGGARKIKGGTYCALKILLNGKVVLEKAQPTQPVADEVEALIELPAGESEFIVGVSIRSGYCGFQLLLQDPKVAKAVVAGDRLLVPTASGKDPPLGDAAARALTVAARETFVSAGQTVPMAAVMLGSTPANLGPLSARFVDPAGKQIGPDLPARTAAELTKSAWQTAYVVPGQSATCEVAVELRAGEKLLGKKPLTLYLAEQLKSAAQQVQQEIAARAAKAGKPLPNAALAAEKAVLFFDKMDQGDEKPSPEVAKHVFALLETAKRCAAEEEQGHDPWAASVGYFERAYHSAIDEASQPYFCGVPSSYSRRKDRAERKYPLVVFLHGYVPSYDKHHWWDEMPDFNRHFDKHDAFLAIPFGRSNTDFQSCGEADVLDCIADMKRLYPIDDDRVYLYGYSMGGMAVYTIAAHNPDLFAAGVVLAGRADSPLQNFRPLERFHPYKQWLIEADNPISLCENFVNIPLRIYHGKNDSIISVKEAQRMEKRLQEIGADAKLTVNDGDHWFGFEPGGVMSQEEPVVWLLEQRRKQNAERNRLKAFRLEHARNGNVAVTAATGVLQPLELEWTAKDGKVDITRETKNILQKRIGEQMVPDKIDGLHKTPQLCGPVREAICRPFLIVYGTSGNAAANKLNREQAERCAREWYAFTRSRVAIKADKEVTDADKKAKNLFLFGEEQDNLLHAAAAKSLPIAAKNGEVTIGDKTLKLAGKGLLYIYPSPFGAERSVVICCGIYYGRSVGVNHKLDLVPDFLLYTDDVDNDGTGTNSAVVAGFFDGFWKINPQSTWWFGK